MVTGRLTPQQHSPKSMPVTLLNSAQAVLAPATNEHIRASQLWDLTSVHFQNMLESPEIPFAARLAISQQHAVLIVEGIVNGVAGSDKVAGHRNALATATTLLDILALLEDKHPLPAKKPEFYADTAIMVRAATTQIFLCVCWRRVCACSARRGKKGVRSTAQLSIANFRA